MMHQDLTNPIGPTWLTGVGKQTFINIIELSRIGKDNLLRRTQYQSAI